MTQDAQAALRRSMFQWGLWRCVTAAVIEKFTKNARFCLTCNYVSKIIPALQVPLHVMMVAASRATVALHALPLRPSEH